MININLLNNNGYKWHGNGKAFVKGFIADSNNQQMKEKKLLEYFNSSVSFSDFMEKAGKANGLFSVVIEKKDSLWAAIDHTRAFPLFYHIKGDEFYITDNPDTITKANSIPFLIDEESAIAIACSGFTLYEKTLLKNIFQVQAGEGLCFENNSLAKEFHTSFLSNNFNPLSRKELKEQLKNILEKVAERLIKLLDGRPVAIPLSGGYDSRLVALMLKKCNYENVLCYTFGENSCPERENAKKTAERLGFKHIFIDYGKYRDFALAKDPLFNDYVNFASNYSAVFSEQQFYALRELVNIYNIPPNTVFIPGHSGAVAGDLLTEKMNQSNFSFSDFLLGKVFSYIYLNKKESSVIRKEIAELDDKTGQYPAFMVYENWRFRETTTKFGYHDSKIFDFFGFEYLLPLADKILFDFFSHIPFEHKFDKNLYMELLSEQFEEFNISFQNKELYPSKHLAKRVAFNSTLKNHIPFLKYFVNIYKNNTTGSRYYSRSFAKELKASGRIRKKLSINGIFSQWYMMKVRNFIETL
ncbi:MAG: hypothetical protein LBS54_01035 [Dysgonamonadaceae bacterium]|jgi:asparagine synthase (glutamine-hydrolysing)|nr:hypothetical protein [Dysgonamonadaceae bacterium]